MNRAALARNRRRIDICDRERNEQLVTIESLDDIYQHADELKAALSVYEAPKQG